MIGFILWLIVGGVAGFVAGRFMGAEHSIPVNVALGIAGAVLGNIVLWVLGFSGDGNLLGQLVMGIIGACVLIWSYRAYLKRNR